MTFYFYLNFLFQLCFLPYSMIILFYGNSILPYSPIAFPYMRRIAHIKLSKSGASNDIHRSKVLFIWEPISLSLICIETWQLYIWNNISIIIKLKKHRSKVQMPYWSIEKYKSFPTCVGSLTSSCPKVEPHPPDKAGLNTPSNLVEMLFA